ncbi:MAG: Gmad2 immunoglobulin-like domain-containing protein, partial [Acidimicrobiia bacterium]|nr:Gmad2 immunoglobulin-like domain-containing protein [Acidimicrobiia bacterium]
CCGTITTTSATRPDATVASGPSTTEAGVGVPCLEGSSGFFGDGPLGSHTRDAADAATVTGLALLQFDGCERLTVELAAASGAPATSLGTTSAELIRRSGVVRIHLDPSVANTTVSDLVFDGSWIGPVYVVRDFDESLFIDVHLADAAVARFSEISNPARLVVDIAPGGSELLGPERSDFIVVMPLPESLSPPVTIEGYGRTFEANIILRARVAGEIVAEDFTTATDYLGTWGRFEIALPPTVTGELELFIGEDSARDGEEQGIRLQVTVEG